MVFADKCLVSDPFNIDLSLLDYTGLGKDTLLCYDDSLVLEPQLNNVNYLWQDGSTANRYVVKQPGNYSVQISNAEGCSVTKNIVVNFQQCAACQLYLPTAFTPNGDGLNDVFRVKTICARVDDFHLIIYNRWGQPVFESSNIDKGWDGAYHSNPMPTGTYVYVIRYKKYGAAAMQQQTGLVTLLR
jgi:gliding motility-associated-like protein